MFDYVEIMLGAAFLLVIVALLAMMTFFEVRTFNSCTGSNASFWDGAFVELRVLECDRT